MQVDRQGLISITVGKLVLLSNFLDKIGFRTVVNKTTNYAIRDYQQYISPHKGFSCAHRKLYGGESCSEYFRRLVISYGLSQAIPMLQQRLKDCQQSYEILKISISEENLEEEVETEIEIDEENLKEQQIKKKSESSSTSVNWCRNVGSCDGGDFPIPLWGPCDTNHNGVFDVGDCSGCDISCDV